MYKINVLIVTYKQAGVIGRNIESILQQKEYGLNKIVICDDHSPDNNWEVIQQYVKKYPDYIEAYHNESNLGIYGNSNKLITLRGKADFYCWLEGDDALCDGFFKKAQEFIVDNKIDSSNAVGIFSGYKKITPEGKEIDNNNDYLSQHPKRNPFGAYSRGFMSWRSGLYSSSVLDRFHEVDTSMGLSLAEYTFDSQWFLHIDEAFYMPYISSIYYSGIGVSTFIYGGEYDKSEAYTQYTYYLENNAITVFDRFWGKCHIIRADYCSNPHNSIFKKIWGIISFSFDFLVGSLPYGINWGLYFSYLSAMIKKL